MKLDIDRTLSLITLISCLVVSIIPVIISHTTTTINGTQKKTLDTATGCRKNQKCSYRISKLAEDEYNTVKTIMENLINTHWNVTIEFANLYFDTNLKACDQYIENVAVDKVQDEKRGDFRHPIKLFKTLDKENRTMVYNQTIREQYDAEWYEKYKFIKTKLQSRTNFNKCNALGLKLYALMYQANILDLFSINFFHFV